MASVRRNMLHLPSDIQKELLFTDVIYMFVCITSGYPHKVLPYGTEI